MVFIRAHPYHPWFLSLCRGRAGRHGEFVGVGWRFLRLDMPFGAMIAIGVVEGHIFIPRRLMKTKDPVQRAQASPSAHAPNAKPPRIGLIPRPRWMSGRARDGVAF